jgi:hypothetical protein
MAPQANRAGRAGWGAALILVFCVLAPSLAKAAEPHFPQPLHLTRRIDDPVARATIELEEYYAGNRAVTVRGQGVVIVDYDRQEVTEIDRAGETWAVTRFDEIARAGATSANEKRTVGVNAVRNPSPVVSLGRRVGVARREVEQFAIQTEAAKVELSVDSSVRLSRSAFDILLGAAYPSQPTPHHSDLARAAVRVDSARGIQADAARPETYGLPAEQSTTWEVEGRKITLRNVIVRVGDELVPPTLVSIPPGAQRVESRLTAVPRLSEELDRIPARH